ncbi:CocE/NonD family hydrolase [Kribbella sp. NPDC058245]|uniref:CocE/NonD family hydrolase n=1 Tax=Kribbella sp. NPDC058245 TaxID=3346399 RepID=UPI0036EE557B
MRKRLLALTGALVFALAPVVAPPAVASQTAATAWTPQPEPETYGRSTPVTATVTMDDGVAISVQIVYPTNPATGQRAPGTFPVLVSQNPYGTQLMDPTTAGDYFVKRGYIYVVSAVRGTGTSGGQLDWFGERQGKDGAVLVNWAARTLDGSAGTVGLDGCSYLGVNQWYTAAAVGPNSALKAIAPFCTDSSSYEDLAAAGGIPSQFVPQVATVIPRGPQSNAQNEPIQQTVNDLKTGGPRSYNNDYWNSLSIEQLMPKIVANGIPALSESGWNDLFPAGNIGAYVAGQNAYYGRPLTAPIKAGQPVTGRYQAIVGPWTHGANVSGDVLANIRKEWFDTWLKGKPTGMADTTTPLHLFQNQQAKWVDSAAWPPSLRTESYYLNTGGTLTANQPTVAGADTIYWSAPWFPATYNSPAFTEPKVLDGPINVTTYLKSTTKDAQVTATVNLVNPYGFATKLADGTQLASLRQLDTSKSWYGDGNALIKASHPFTQASQQFLTPTETVKVDISVLPNFTLIPAGYRLQVVLSSQTPSNFHIPMAPTPQQQANLNYGQFAISRSPGAASSVTLPLTSPSQFGTSPIVWGPSS